MSTYYMPGIILYQRLANIFYKRPDSKYFRLCELYDLCHYYPTLLLFKKKKKAAIENM